ncbi:12459_t:CDS:2 [Rhizophagus irregularis]|nr:12459_t:CDS:2 [Rhizophagus irregularis]
MLYNDVIPRYFKNLTEPVNSDITKTTLHLDEINQDKENNTE